VTGGVRNPADCHCATAGSRFKRIENRNRSDAALEDGNLLPEDMDESNPHPTGIALDKPAPAH